MRNIRVTIPKRLAKMVTDLAERDLDMTLFTRVCEQIANCMEHTQRNSARIFSYILKQLSTMKADYKKVVSKTILAGLIRSVGQELTKEIPDANK